MRFPVTLESSATSRRFEEAVAMAAESQMQALSRDQDDRPAITGVSGEIAVPVDVSQAQSPGKIFSRGGLSCDLESEPASISPGHPAIGSVFPDLSHRGAESRIIRPTGAMKMVTRIKSGRRMSQAVVHGNTVYLAGQVASDLPADTAGQTREVLASIDKLLAEAGTDKTHLLAATVYLTDMSTFNEMNAVWDAWVAAGCAPARATVGAPLASAAYRVEIVVIAARP